MMLAAMVCWAGAATSSASGDAPTFLQWFETRWSTMEYRMPDFFMAGYDSTWIPPVAKAADASSPGYDVFDRFDLGSPGAETAYGTEAGLKALVQEFHQASALVYPDLIMNHNSGRNNSNDFYNAGGYPGFALRVGADFWGDFHDGTQQSIDPGGPNYNLFNGDLVGLIDIAQEKNYLYIRQPIGADPQNIRAGTIRNRPDPNNRRFYPDLQLPPATFVNSAKPAGQQNVTVYPFNTANPLAGDPVQENATAYLVRSTQWLLEVIGVDGFRLDAAKHIPQWFWNEYWDSGVFNRRKTFTGGTATPFSFGEIVDSNSFTLTYTRKDGFGNRDALDLNGAGKLRDLLNGGGFASWQTVLDNHLDGTDNGLQDGSRGVMHVFSHDNGSAGDGGSAPPLPGPDRYGLPEHCYMLFRPGPAIIYHNSREFIDRYQFRGFWPREGSPTALGGLSNNLVRLIQGANSYARGQFNIRNSGINDVLVFERRKQNGVNLYESNVIVAVNDSYSPGVTQLNVYTSFPAGTRLHEITGTAADPVVDSANQIPEVVTTQTFNGAMPSIAGAQSWMTITVPFNKNASGVNHHRGYVVYGPAIPTGTLQVRKPDGSAFTGVIPADGPSVPSYRRRLTSIPVVDTPTFDLVLTTNKTDPSDPDWDDFAAFRIDGGYPSAGSATDFNDQNNGPDFSDTDPFLPRFEAFRTEVTPLATTPGATNGVYRQTIDTSRLSEGYHYIRVIAFRKRPSNTDPLYADFRLVIYVDRTAPLVNLANAAGPITSPIVALSAVPADRTTQRAWILLNPPVGVDPLTLISNSNIATQYDRFDFRRTVSGLQQGANTVTVVAEEVTGRRSVTTFAVNVEVGSGDINRDGVTDINDLYAGFAALAVTMPPYDPAGDVNADGSFNLNDLRLLEQNLRPAELGTMSKPER
jgi:hypothetical protein